MKKIIIGISLILIFIFLIVFVQNRNTNIIQTDKQDIETQISQNTETTEYQYKHFDPSIGVSDGRDYYEYMTSLNGIYYKKISNYQEYLLYKKRWNDILDMKEEDFKNYFMVITIPESDSLIGTTLGELYVDNNKIYIGLKEFEDINEYVSNENCISIIISNHMNSDEIEPFRTVEKYDNSTSEYCDIKSLPKEYSKTQAIEDSCFVIDGLELYNKELFDTFINNVNSKIDSCIRIVKYDNTEIVIEDIQYISEKNKFILCTDYTRALLVMQGHGTYNYYEYSELEEREARNNGISYVLTNVNEKFGIPSYILDFPICTINPSFTIIND